MKTVLVTGGAGSVGYEVVKQLVVLNQYKVRVLELPTKKAKRRLQHFKEQVALYYGSIEDLEFVRQAVKGVDYVIHLAAIIPPLADMKPELTRRVNFFGTRNIITVMLEQENMPFLFYSSSVSIYGDRVENYFIEVGDPLCPSEGDYYAATKIATEALIQESGVSYTIFRLTGIMGYPKTDPLMFHMPLDTKLEIATVLDTARAFVLAIEHTKELKGKIFNLGGGEKCRTTYRDFLISMFSIYGLNIRYLKDSFFAEKNFHCGYFKDGDKLEAILHFRKDTLETYYARVKKQTKGVTAFFSKLFSRPIIAILGRKSEPYQAKKKHQQSLLDRFYKKP